MNPRAALYLRLSKEDASPDDSESIKNQRDLLITHCLSQKWAIYQIYSDDDYAGSDAARPAWKAMLRDAEQGLFDIVLCKTQSRFSRDMTMVEHYIHGKFPEWGVRFVGLVDNADTAVKGNKKARQINSLVNEWYLEDLSENVRAVYHEKMLKGEYIATFPPYGYSKDPDRRNHLIPNPVTAPIVCQIFKMYENGFGTQKIARALTAQGIPNPRKYQEIHGLRKTKMYAPEDPAPWSAYTVGDILKNRAYCGDVVQNTVNKVSYKSKKLVKIPREQWIVVKNMHEAIIPRESFEAVQKLLSLRRRSTSTGRPHPLAGKVYCAKCGRTMQKNGPTTLRCRNKYAPPPSERCNTPSISLDVLLSEISSKLNVPLKLELLIPTLIEKIMVSSEDQVEIHWASL